MTENRVIRPTTQADYCSGPAGFIIDGEVLPTRIWDIQGVVKTLGSDAMCFTDNEGRYRFVLPKAPVYRGPNGTIIPSILEIDPNSSQVAFEQYPVKFHFHDVYQVSGKDGSIYVLSGTNGSNSTLILTPYGKYTIIGSTAEEKE